MRDYISTVSKATAKAFEKVSRASEPAPQDNEVANYMKLTPSDFASLVSEFGMTAVEPYIRQMEMRRMRERGHNA